MAARFSQDVYLVQGLRTPFGRGGGALAHYDALSLSVPLVQAMAGQVRAGRPDLFVWGSVIPNLGWSNLAREVWLDAGLNPTVPALSAILACATSMAGAFAAAGMLGGGIDLVLVGGVETMSRPAFGLTAVATERLMHLMANDLESAVLELGRLSASDFNLPTKGWANRITGRTMGDHMEDTAKIWSITRTDQDAWAYESHLRAAAGWKRGFFDDLVVALPTLSQDANVRADTSLERLAALKPAFDKSPAGTLTAGNSSPITDGAAGVWVANQDGRRRLPDHLPTVRLVDYELAAVDVREEGLLMAPAYAIPRLLARHALSFESIDLWEIHEAFAAQVLANVAAISNPEWVAAKPKVEANLGQFPRNRVNPNGGSLAIGHPFGATGARDLSQAVKELAALPQGARAIVSVCADGGHAAVALLENI